MTDGEKEGFSLPALGFGEDLQERLPRDAGVENLYHLLMESMESLAAAKIPLRLRHEVQKVLSPHGYRLPRTDQELFDGVLEELEDLAADTPVGEIFGEDSVFLLEQEGFTTVSQVVEAWQEEGYRSDVLELALRQFWASEAQPRRKRSG